MSKRLKACLQWTMYIFGVIFLILGFVFPLIKLAICKDNDPVLISAMNWFGIGLSFFSLLLGTFSLFLSYQDGKHAKSTLEKIKMISSEIKNSQAITLKYAFAYSKTVPPGTNNDWLVDETGENE